ncbi:hypothetical protein ACWEN6_39390 [Sphaerisporangium sp. NPDC004334]
MSLADVSGLATTWGIVTLIMTVLALTLVIADGFTRSRAAVWAAIPGALAVASVVAVLLRRDDLHSRHRTSGCFRSLSHAAWV